MKRILFVLLAAVLLLTGCEPKIRTNVVDLPDGRHVLCVYEGKGYGGGPSCDWDHAK